MSKSVKSGYGVLQGDMQAKVSTVNFRQDIESRLCLPHPSGNGSVLTLVTRLSANGAYEFIVEDAYHQARASTTGNLYEEVNE